MRRGSPRPASEVAEPLRLIPRLRHREWRDRTGLFYAEGVSFLMRAAQRPGAIDTLVVSWKLLQATCARKLVRSLRRAGTRCLLVSPETFRGFSRQPRASGVGIVVRQHWSSLAQIDPRQGTAWLLMREVRSPGNLGTLMRSLAAVGGGGAIFLGDDADAFDPAVVRATMGALFGLQLVRTTEEELLRFKARFDCQVIGTSPAAELDYSEVRWGPASIIFLGGERQGLSPADVALCDRVVKIPMTAEVDSLNLGVAGSLMLFEAFRGRR